MLQIGRQKVYGLLLMWANLAPNLCSFGIQHFANPSQAQNRLRVSNLQDFSVKLNSLSFIQLNDIYTCANLCTTCVFLVIDAIRKQTAAHISLTYLQEMLCLECSILNIKIIRAKLLLPGRTIHSCVCMKNLYITIFLVLACDIYQHL